MNFTDDPLEQHNVFDEHQELVTDLLLRLRGYHAQRVQAVVEATRAQITDQNTVILPNGVRAVKVGHCQTAQFIRRPITDECYRSDTKPIWWRI